MIEVGVYPNLSNEAYHSDAAISRSGIMKFRESPYLYWAEYLNPDRPKRESTPAMEFGTDFHTLILEPELFNKKYENLSTKKLKNDYEVLHNMMWALDNHKEARELIYNSIFEQSYFWNDIHTGLRCKTRPDILSDNYVIDLKTVNNASEKYIQRAIFDYGYDVQMAMIKDSIFEITGNKIQNFILICVEKTYPYQIGIYFLDSEIIERAKSTYKNALLQMKECFEKNNWPSYEPSIISLPNYLR